MLYKLRKRGIPAAQICKQSFAAHPPFLLKPVVVLEQLIQANMHDEKGRDWIGLQVSLHLVISVKEHKLEELVLCRENRFRLHLPGFRLQLLQFVCFVEYNQRFCQYGHTFASCDLLVRPCSQLVEREKGEIKFHPLNDRMIDIAARVVFIDDHIDINITVRCRLSACKRSKDKCCQVSFFLLKALDAAVRGEKTFRDSSWYFWHTCFLLMHALAPTHEEHPSSHIPSRNQSSHC